MWVNKRLTWPKKHSTIYAEGPVYPLFALSGASKTAGKKKLIMFGRIPIRWVVLLFHSEGHRNIKNQSDPIMHRYQHWLPHLPWLIRHMTKDTNLTDPAKSKEWPFGFICAQQNKAPQWEASRPTPDLKQFTENRMHLCSLKHSRKKTDQQNAPPCQYSPNESHVFQ